MPAPRPRQAPTSRETHSRPAGGVAGSPSARRDRDALQPTHGPQAGMTPDPACHPADGGRMTRPHFQAALCSLSLSSSTLEYAAWASSDNSRLRTAGRHDSADNSVRFLSAATAGTDKPESPRQSITTQESDLRHPGTPGRKPGRLPLCLRQTAEEHASAPRQVRKKNAFQQGKNAAHIKKNGSQLDFYITGTKQQKKPSNFTLAR